MDNFAIAKRNLTLFIGNLEPSLRIQARYGKVLKLCAIGDIRQIQRVMILNPRSFGLGSRRPRQPQQHRHRIFPVTWRAASAIIDVTGLAGAGVVKWAQAIGCLRGGWRRHPELLEQRISQFEILLLLEGDAGGGWEKAVVLETACVVVAPADIASNGSGFEKSVVGFVTCRTRLRSDLERSVRVA